MALESTLSVLNEMQAVGVLGEYAVGGAVAAFLYIEPGTTFDLDIFTAWKAVTTRSPQISTDVTNPQEPGALTRPEAAADQRPTPSAYADQADLA